MKTTKVIFSGKATHLLEHNEAISLCNLLRKGFPMDANRCSIWERHKTLHDIECQYQYIKILATKPHHAKRAEYAKEVYARYKFAIAQILSASGIEDDGYLVPVRLIRLIACGKKVVITSAKMGC